MIRDGRSVQTGTREDIWYRPYDTEVARAFGRPRINLLPGTVTGDGGFRSADGKVRLPLGTPAPAGADVVVGMRPRDITLTGEGHDRTPDGHGLTGTVYVTEVLGRSVEVTVRLGGQHVSLVVPRGARPDCVPTIRYGWPSGLRACCCSRPTGPGAQDD